MPNNYRIPIGFSFDEIVEAQKTDRKYIAVDSNGNGHNASYNAEQRTMYFAIPETLSGNLLYIPVDELPPLTADNAQVGSFYAFCSGWMQLKRIVHPSQEEIEEFELFYKVRFEAVDWHGYKIGGGLAEDDEMEGLYTTC